MKKILFGCVLALSGLVMPLASAQDCCYGPQDCCYGPDFNGFYVGGNFGVFSRTAHLNDLDGFLTDNGSYNTISTGGVVGLQLGYDWQCCNKLFGLVVDWNWARARQKVHDNPNVIGDDNFIHTKHNWFSTIRGRAGVTMCDALVYITLGAAAAKHHLNWHDSLDNFAFRHTRWGWVGGVGTEFMLGCNWSIGAEVLFLQFSHHEHSGTNLTGTRFTFAHSDSAWVGRILINYRFGDLFSCCGL